MHYFFRVLTLMCVALLAACSTVVKVSQPDAPLVSLPQAQQGYAAVLQRHVNVQGEVDFAALRADASPAGLPSLEAYVQAIAATPLQSAPSADARLAHMINAYNALSMYNVIASGIPASHAGWSKVTFFLLRKFDIRKLGDPRIHFALNCSAVSCPVLPRAPFTADKLNEELDRETQAFFAKPENLRIDHAQRTVVFNEILKFYTEDFTPSPASSLIAYAQRYTKQSIPTDYQTLFKPYDWTVANSQRKR
jgi:Protein of unknown function, DUF547